MAPSLKPGSKMQQAAVSASKAPAGKSLTATALIKEEHTVHSSYAAAAMAACEFVNKGGKKVDPKSLVLYTKNLPANSANTRTVGVGIKTQAGVVRYLVRIDLCPEKGIHFNATGYADPRRVAACSINGTLGGAGAKTVNPLVQQRFEEYVKVLQSRSPDFIFEWWRTGKNPALLR